ncbi:MAG: BPTI/Kunitz domain-containing protein [Cytophagales bacterium]
MKNKVFFWILLVQLLSCGDCDRPKACSLKPDAGFCMAAFKRYYYDSNQKKCKEFTWGGCGGVVPFNSLEECSKCLCN